MTRNNKRCTAQSFSAHIGKSDRPSDKNDFVFSSDPAKWGIFGSQNSSRKKWDDQKRRKKERTERSENNKRAYHKKMGDH